MSNNMKRANHFGEVETFLNGLKEQCVKGLVSASVWLKICLLS